MKHGYACGALLSKQFARYPYSRNLSPSVRTSLHSTSTKAIIVACLASFPSLFKKSERASHQRIHEGNCQSYSRSNMRRALFSGTKKSKASREDSENISMDNVGQERSDTMKGADMDFSPPWHEHSKSSTDTMEPIIPVDKAHIRHE